MATDTTIPPDIGRCPAACADLYLARLAVQQQGNCIDNGAVRGKLKADTQPAWVPRQSMRCHALRCLPCFINTANLEGEVEPYVFQRRWVDHRDLLAEFSGVESGNLQEAACEILVAFGLEPLSNVAQ